MINTKAPTVRTLWYRSIAFNRAMRWKPVSSNADFAPIPTLPLLAHQEPVSMEYKFTHEWKDKCLAEESDGKRRVEGACCKSTEII